LGSIGGSLSIGFATATQRNLTISPNPSAAYARDIVGRFQVGVIRLARFRVEIEKQAAGRDANGTRSNQCIYGVSRVRNVHGPLLFAAR
jgi:hypothetical protein